MYIRLAFLFFTVLTFTWISSAKAQDQMICGRRFTSPDELLADITRQPGTTRQLNNQNIDVFIEKGGLTTWAFYQSPHPAAPTVVCSRLEQGANRDWYRFDRIICGAAKPTCDALKKDYDELAKTMRRDIEEKRRKAGQRT
jgi:hypothetical protein